MSEPPQDYDGTSSNVENVKILQRRLTAWPTHDKASGIGDLPDRLVGTTTISNTIDQISLMNSHAVDHPMLGNKRNQEAYLAGLP